MGTVPGAAVQAVKLREATAEPSGAHESVGMKTPRDVSPDEPVYRPDIDGLRAVAVVAVVLYHSRIAGWEGGYVGVDVFFVISGYLITLVLAASNPRRLRMGLGNFYLRRARRILPAMLLTSLVVTVAAVVILLPWNLIRFGKYLAASAVALTNITAWTDTNYFNVGALDVPLLHYWSLAVEEQFYLVYPATLLIIGRWVGSRRLPALAVLTCASLGLCIWASTHRPTANFYWAPTRGWELLLGALVALSSERGGWRRLPAELAAVCSLLAIAFAIYSFGSAVRYPGVLTLVPCLATATLIATGRAHRTWVARLLSLPPLVFTGCISYALYLWHLPVLVLFRYYNIEGPGTGELLLLLALIYALAVTSWLLIERPIHRRTLLRPTPSFLLACLIATSVVLTSGVLLWRSDGLPKRFSPEVVALANGGLTPPEGERACTTLLAVHVAVGRLCRYGPDTAEDGGSVLLWGDSHAMRLVSPFEAEARVHHLRLYAAGMGGCRPLLGVASRTVSEPDRAACAEFNEAVVRAIASLNPRLIVLSGHWIDPEHDLLLRPGFQVASGQSKLARALENTLPRIRSADRAICVVQDVPTFKYDVPYALAMARRRGIDTDFLGVTRDDALAQYRDADAAFRELERSGVLRIADPKDALCRSGSCAFQAQGRPLYSDSNHLSIAGVEFVASSLARCFDGVR
jgi:peptidoglycan/LPS O-acetylase OafA/YrhL